VVKHVLKQNPDAELSTIKRILITRIHKLLDNDKKKKRHSNNSFFSKAQLPPTTTYDRVQPHSQVPFVLSGYRQNTHTMTACFKSIFFQWHKETVNVWTHLGGTIYFTYLFLDHVIQNVQTLDFDTFAFMCMFYVGAIMCLGFSALMHSCTNLYDFKKFEFLLMLDFVGICVMVYASSIPGIYFGFACFPTLQVFYCLILTVLCLMSVVCSIDSETGVFGKIRVAITAGTTTFGLVPLFHWCAVMPYEEIVKFFPPTITMLAMYGLGFVFYITKFPESKFPNRFDYLGSSHQFWHLAVLAAALLWQNTLHNFGTEEHVCPAADVSGSSDRWFF